MGGPPIGVQLPPRMRRTWHGEEAWHQRLKCGPVAEESAGDRSEGHRATHLTGLDVRRAMGSGSGEHGSRGTLLHLCPREISLQPQPRTACPRALLNGVNVNSGAGRRVAVVKRNSTGFGSAEFCLHRSWRVTSAYATSNLRFGSSFVKWS